MKKLIISVGLIISLFSCGVLKSYEEDLLVPHPGDYQVIDVTDKWITIENAYDSHRLRNTDSLTVDNIGDWLILEDEFRWYD